MTIRAGGPRPPFLKVQITRHPGFSQKFLKKNLGKKGRIIRGPDLRRPGGDLGGEGTPGGCGGRAHPPQSAGQQNDIREKTCTVGEWEVSERDFRAACRGEKKALRSLRARISFRALHTPSPSSLNWYIGQPAGGRRAATRAKPPLKLMVGPQTSGDFRTWWKPGVSLRNDVALTSWSIGGGGAEKTIGPLRWQRAGLLNGGKKNATHPDILGQSKAALGLGKKKNAGPFMINQPPQRGQKAPASRRPGGAGGFGFVPRIHRLTGFSSHRFFSPGIVGSGAAGNNGEIPPFGEMSFAGGLLGDCPGRERENRETTIKG